MTVWSRSPAGVGIVIGIDGSRQGIAYFDYDSDPDFDAVSAARPVFP
jgi:hypothetical protein